MPCAGPSCLAARGPAPQRLSQRGSSVSVCLGNVEAAQAHGSSGTSTSPVPRFGTPRLGAKALRVARDAPPHTVSHSLESQRRKKYSFYLVGIHTFVLITEYSFLHTRKSTIMWVRFTYKELSAEDIYSCGCARPIAVHLASGGTSQQGQSFPILYTRSLNVSYNQIYTLLFTALNH